MKKENDFKELLLELNNLDNETIFPPQEEENDDDFYKRENYAKPILKKMTEIYSPEFSDMIIKELDLNYLNWKGFFICRFIREIKEVKAIKPLIKLLPKIHVLDILFDEIIKTLIDFGESASVYLREEYHNRVSNDKDIMDLLKIIIQIADPQNKDLAINSSDRLVTSDIELYVNLLSNTKDLDYLPVLQKLRKKFRRLPKLRKAIDSSIDSLSSKSSKSKTFSKNVERFQEESIFKLHKEAKNAEKNGELKKSYEIYDYLSYVDFNNFKSLYGKARVGFKLKKYDYELARLALEQAIESDASLVWINEIKLFKQKLKEKLIQMDDFDEGDDYRWMAFKCKNCGKEQILRTGKMIMILSEDVTKNVNFYEHEIMCKECNSRELKLSGISKIQLLFDIFPSGKEHPDIVKSSENLSFDNNEIKINRLHKFIENQLRKRKKDAVFYLRSGNALKKINLWDEALRLYKISQKIDPLLLSNYYSLLKINAFRFYDFGNKNAREIALSYLEKLKSIPPEELNYIFMSDLFDLDEFIKEMDFYLKNDSTKAVS